MVDAFIHRGPDASGTTVADNCHLGHARLSILDLASGAQPLADATRRYWITYNGEIYNYRDVRDALVKLGFRFLTHSDTEVVLNAFLGWGAASLDHFRGMFAYAIWDSVERELFAARDLFGEKPLYYATSDDGTLLIASEIKAILGTRLIDDALDLGSIDAYLALGYVPPDRTAYRNIHTLPPAHFLRWKDGAITITRYWSPRLETHPISLEEAAERLRELLEQSVRRQMIADVEVGALLSGGTDSSTIVALAQSTRGEKNPLKTFSVGFGKSINELPFASTVATMHGTEHYAIDIPEPPVAELLEELVRLYDEPFADSSSIPTYAISEYASRFVKVVLTGDGADELFGGYSRHIDVLDTEHVNAPLLQWIAFAAARRLVPRSRTFPEKARAARLAMLPDPWSRCILGQTIFGLRARARMWGGRGTARETPSYFSPPAGGHGLARALAFDLTSYLPGNLLVKVDRASMAHGLETRAPFLDRDVAEFAMGLPDSLKVDDGRTKVVLRAAFEAQWPESIRKRPKQGFAAPTADWLMRPEMRSLVKRVFADGSALRNLLPGATLPANQNDLRTWTLLMLGLWLEKRHTSISKTISGSTSPLLFQTAPEGAATRLA
jgi:asparagine synthase (glutamine-hydrolysing)